MLRGGASLVVGWTLMILIGCNLVRLSMQSKHYPWRINFYLALCPLSYLLRRIRVTWRKVLDNKWVLYRHLTTNSIMERVNHGPYNLLASRGRPL